MNFFHDNFQFVTNLDFSYKFSFVGEIYIYIYIYIYITCLFHLYLSDKNVQNIINEIQIKYESSNSKNIKVLFSFSTSLKRKEKRNRIASSSVRKN